MALRKLPVSPLVVVLLVANVGLAAVAVAQQRELRAARISASVDSSSEEAAPVAGSGDPSGDTQTVSVQTVLSGKEKLVFVHECQGEVKTPAPFSYMDAAADMPSYCVGKNFLSVKDMGGAEVALVSESTSTSAEDAPVLQRVAWVSQSTRGKIGTVLVEYGIVPCVVSEDGCGVGMPMNNVTFAVNFVTKDVRAIANYPSDGTPIWNDAGTKAIFPVVQRGGAGCDDHPLTGYDLATDTTKALTEEVACEFDDGLSFDVEGNPFPVWGPTFWTSDDTFTAVLLGTDGKWKQIDGTF